jgi:poly(A) polymerase
MPIITPAYPSMCATHNITHSTKAVILGEIHRANGICQNILSGKKSWDDLFAKHTFFTDDYKYYLSIVSASRTKEAQQIWSGLVQSKVRRLVSAIEMSDTGVDVAHPFNKGFDRIHWCKDEEEVNKVFQGELNFQISEEKLAEVQAAENGAEAESKPTVVYTTSYYIGLKLSNLGGMVKLSAVDANRNRRAKAGHHQSRCRVQTAMCRVAAIQP